MNFGGPQGKDAWHWSTSCPSPPSPPPPLPTDPPYTALYKNDVANNEYLLDVVGGNWQSAFPEEYCKLKSSLQFFCDYWQISAKAERKFHCHGKGRDWKDFNGLKNA